MSGCSRGWGQALFHIHNGRYLDTHSMSGSRADKSAEAVTQATIELLLPCKDLVHMITADNGNEFAYHERIAAALDAKVYFAHPCHSWEQGRNENANGLLRQYWPRQAELKSVSSDEMAAAVTQKRF